MIIDTSNLLFADTSISRTHKEAVAVENLHGRGQRLETIRSKIFRLEPGSGPGFYASSGPGPDPLNFSQTRTRTRINKPSRSRNRTSDPIK